MAVSRAVKKWLVIVCSILLVLLIATGIYLSYLARHSEERLREFVTQALSEKFKSEVELRAIHVKVFPRLAVDGDGLILRHHGRTDVPPLIHIGHFSFKVGIIGLLRPVKHIPLVTLKDMTINIPPRKHDRGEKDDNKGKQNRQPATGDSGKKPSPDIIVDKIICDNTDILIIPKQPDKVPLDWDIHDLVLYSVGPDKPFSFRGNLTNGKPRGEIVTQGQFGPWDAEDPGGSPVSGDYKFTDADLDPFPGISGTLSSTGQFHGILAELQVTGETGMPDFSLDKVGKPVPLHTEYSATVDGTNGDTLLHPVNATLVQSLIITNGSVVGIPHQGKLITMDAVVPDGRIQDMLSLAINSDKPLMTGPVKIKAKLVIPPGKEKALDKIVLDGQFGVDDAHWSSPALREKLKSLSRHAQGEPEDKDVGSAVSDLKGAFHMEKGIIHFQRLTFSVEGARIDLAGTYGVRGGELDLKGHLRLEAKLSDTMTGAKSFFLKIFDPFFSKDGAGTVLPISITGTREKPVFGVSVFHKTIKKSIATSGDSSDKKN
jgi:hypothetical protein